MISHTIVHLNPHPPGVVAVDLLADGARVGACAALCGDPRPELPQAGADRGEKPQPQR